MKKVLLASLLFVGCQSVKEEAAVCPVITAAPSEDSCKEISDRRVFNISGQLDECKKSLAARPPANKIESKPDVVIKNKKSRRM